MMRFQGKCRKVPRLAWMAFVGEIPAGLEVCHKCDMPGCFRPDHLFLGTHHENMRDAAEKERMGGLFGVEHHSAKLDPEKVCIIRSHISNKTKQVHELAREFGVSKNAIHKIRLGKSWKSVA